MFSLGTVQPNRVLVLDNHRINRHIVFICRGRHKTGVYTGNVGVLRNRLAGGIKGRLRDRVVTGNELELDGFAWFDTAELGGGEG